MRPNWPKLGSLVQKTCALDSFGFFALLPKDNPYLEHSAL